jgi:predicted PurR-regulated permease PerM
MNIPSRTIFKVLIICVAFGAVLTLAYLARHQLAWIGIAFFFAVSLNPFVERMGRYMPKHNRGTAIASVFLMVFALITFLLVSFVPPLIQQSQALFDNLPHYTEEFVKSDSFLADQVRRYNLVDRVRESQSQLVEYATTAGSQFFNIVSGLFSSFVAGITILGLTFFMLLEGPGWLAAFWAAVPPKSRGHLSQLADEMYKAVTGYSHGILLTASISAIASSVVMTVMGVPYSIPLGILVGLLGLLPMIGSSLAAVVVVIVALFTSTFAAGVMLVYFLVYQQVENHIIQPFVVGRAVSISPLLVLIAVLLGISVGGILGALVAIPLFASLQILVHDYMKRHLRAAAASPKQ